MEFGWKRLNRQIDEYQSELVQTHYAEVENMYRQMRGGRHDYRNHIQTMKAYAAKGDLEALRRYLDELDDDLTTLDMVIKTGNPMTDGLRPVMTVDVWEHAYYIDYRNRRPDFLAAFWELIDWQKVADRCIPKRYKCTACDYVYDPAKGDPETGIEPGTPFEEIPDDWTCPICGLYKTDFEAVEE